MNILPILIGIVMGGINPKIRTLEQTLLSPDMEDVNQGNFNNVDY